MKRNIYIHQFQTQSSKNLLPLSAALLTSYAKSIPEISCEYNFHIDIIRRNPSDVIKIYENPDVIAFSTYSWNFIQSIGVAKLAKLNFPNTLIVFGGPMIPFNPTQLNNMFENYPFIDIVVHGMGEWTFSEILLYKLGTKELSSISGITYKNMNLELTTQTPSYDRNINELPSPFLDGTFNNILIQYGDKITGALWETNRGCPYKCTFCVQGNSSFSKILKFDVDRLQKELEWISKNKISYVFGTDANFGILPRDIKIAEMMSNISKNKGYPNYFIINWLKNSNNKIIKIIETLKKGNINTRLTLSAQSFNENTLNAINRKNIEMLEFDNIIKKCSNKNISVYTEIILGLPNDTYQSITQTIDKCMNKHHNHFFIVYLCRSLENTEMSKLEYIQKYKIRTRKCEIGTARHECIDNDIMETEDIVISTSTLSINDWEKSFTFVYTALTLYNFRLSFFIFNYLKEEYSINLIELINYLIENVSNNKKDNDPIYKALNVIDNSKTSLLKNGVRLVSLDFMENVLIEVYDAALLIIIKEKKEFYMNLWKIINEYLLSKNILINTSILKEVFLYQYIRIPTWKNNGIYENNDSQLYKFGFNIPQYFKMLCEEGKKINICEDNNFVEIKIDKMCNNPIDFIKARLTFSTFEIYDVIMKRN